MKNESLKDTVYNAIMQDILMHEFRPNQILNERMLVERYSCSKTPVREALVSLCNDHVLRSIPRYGYEVIRLTTDDIREMLQFRYILESGMLQLCYKSLTDKQLSRLEELDESCTRESGDVWRHWACNSEFHLKLISFCGNTFSLDALERCMNCLKRAYAQFYWDRWDRESPPIDTRNHALIIQSLRERDIDRTLLHLKDDLNDFGLFRESESLI